MTPLQRIQLARIIAERRGISFVEAHNMVRNAQIVVTIMGELKAEQKVQVASISYIIAATRAHGIEA